MAGISLPVARLRHGLKLQATRCDLDSSHVDDLPASVGGFPITDDATTAGATKAGATTAGATTGGMITDRITDGATTADATTGSADSVKAAADVVNEMLDMLKASGGIPGSFWHDPFVLGFVYF